MAVYKCKMCGGTLEIAEGMTVSECEYCGTKQTLPKAQDDATANLFNRANNLRYKSEFDKAQALYEKLVTNYPDDSESYWGLVLCKYGIEYVGYFQIPVGVSNVIHSACAMLLFALLAYNIGWLFTRGNNELNNMIYRICSWAMIAIMAIFVILSIVRLCGVNIPEYLTMIVEAVLLLIFGFAWLVKGRLFKFDRN